MLQRIQTIYLLLAAGISGGLIFMFHIWITNGNVKVYALDELPLFVCS